MNAVMYGAGNIGRGFIGQLFSQSGYEVIFVDVNDEVVERLNIDNEYPIHIISETGNEDIMVKNVRAVNGRDMESVTAEICQADIMATAVGVNVLPRIAGPIAQGLLRRWEAGIVRPLNIIICENLIDANQYLKQLIAKEMSETERILLDERVGFVEASIGRMVPVMTPDMQKGNILRVYVEPFCELPGDRDGFKGEIPTIMNMEPSSPFEFFIKRKLYIHNMGHVMTAYLGQIMGYKYIGEAIGDPDICGITHAAMFESARALSLESGMELKVIHNYVEDLIMRFGNKQLGDTVERVGRDLSRKLAPNDRLLGAFSLCIKQNVIPRNISIGINAAMHFKDSTMSEKMLEIEEHGLKESQIIISERIART